MSDESKDGHSSGDCSGVIEEAEEMGREHLRAPLLDLCIYVRFPPLTSPSRLCYLGIWLQQAFVAWDNFGTDF